MPSRQVEKRRQQVAFLYVAWSHKLWKVEELDGKRIEVGSLSVYIRHHAVGGAKVDTNDITGHSHVVIVSLQFVAVSLPRGG